LTSFDIYIYGYICKQKLLEKNIKKDQSTPLKKFKKYFLLKKN